MTVWTPATDALQVEAVQLPSGLIERVAEDDTSDRTLFEESSASTTKLRLPPTAIEADPGLIERWSTAAAVALSVTLVAAEVKRAQAHEAPSIVATTTRPTTSTLASRRRRRVGTLTIA